MSNSTMSNSAMSNLLRSDTPRPTAHRPATQRSSATAFDFDVVTDAPKLRSRPPEPGAAAPAKPAETALEPGS